MQNPDRISKDADKIRGTVQALHYSLGVKKPTWPTSEPALIISSSLC